MAKKNSVPVILKLRGEIDATVWTSAFVKQFYILDSDAMHTKIQEWFAQALNTGFTDGWEEGYNSGYDEGAIDHTPDENEITWKGRTGNEG